MTQHYPPPPPQHGQYPPPGGYYPPPAPPKKTRKWPWIVAGVIGFFILLGAIGGNKGTSPSTAAPVSSTAVASASSIEAPAPPAPAAPAGPATSFEDGTYEVGVDIAAGKYKTAGADGGFCYWDRTKKNDGSIGDIAQQGVGDGPQTATVKAGEYFKTNGCGTWSKSG